MISELENMDVVISSSLSEREDDSEFGNSVRTSEMPSYDTILDHNSNSHSNSREHEKKGFAGNGKISGGMNLSNELNRLSG